MSWTRFEGHILAKELDKKGLKAIVITDSAVFAMISRVNMVISNFGNETLQLFYIINKISCLNLKFVLKVIVGVHAVMANGGVIAPVGLHVLALAAKKHAVPFVVVASTHEVCWHSKKKKKHYSTLHYNSSSLWILCLQLVHCLMDISNKNVLMVEIYHKITSLVYFLFEYA